MKIYLSAVLVGAGLLAIKPPLIQASTKTSPTAVQTERPQVGGELKLIASGDTTPIQSTLRHTDVQAKISGNVAQVVVEQQFVNGSKVPVEAVYTFPLPSEAAVNAMEFRVGNRRIVGEIKRKEEAHKIYNAAKAEGKRTALLDQERPNIFTQSVANVMPGDDVTVRITFVQNLPYRGGAYEWAFPTVVGPRYTNSGGYYQAGKRGAAADSTKLPPKNTLGARSVSIDPEKVTPPIAPPPTRAGHDISLHVDVAAGVPLGNIRSVLHPIAIQRISKTHAAIVLQNQGTLPNKDFVLRYAVASGQVDGGLLTHSDGKGGGYFSLLLAPPATPKREQISPRELVFVVDQTGSQSGWPLEKAKETMRYALTHLRPGDTFQILGFNTDVYPCFAKPVGPSKANLKQANSFVKKLDAGGGTDILKALDSALKIPDDPKRLRIVLYMTDGYVDNDMQVIDYLRKHRGRARVFPFGMGNSVNRFLLDTMAREGHGSVEYISVDPDRVRPENNSEAEDSVKRFYRHLATPVLIRPQIDGGKLPIADIFPDEIPDVFEQSPIVVAGRYTKPGKGFITLRGYSGNKPWHKRIAVDFGAAAKNNPAIESLWARAKVEDLQVRDYIGAQTGQPDPQIKEAIVQTALDHKLMTQWTSFVAVEQKIVNPGGQNAKNDVPVDIPEGVDYQSATGTDPGGATANGLRYGLSSSGGSFSAQPGDPLIRIKATPDTLRVLAILPDGSLVPLALNAQSKSWEAHFDIPGYVNDGSYQVKILMLRRNGTRTRYNLSYKVDTRSPQAIGAVVQTGATARLSLSAEGDVTRVVAVLPWSQRLPMVRGQLASNWEASVHVPADWTAKEAAVRFILTDKAHNRTEITVDWSR